MVTFQINQKQSVPFNAKDRKQCKWQQKSKAQNKMIQVGIRVNPNNIKKWVKFIKR